jgi:sugar fermentation stimulation protein A
LKRTRSVIPVALPLRTDLNGRLVQRYKRFLADVETDSGEVVTVHCPNPGSMKGTRKPGSLVRCSTSDKPGRKLRHTLEMIRVGRIWVGLHTLRANQLVARALEQGALPALRGYAEIRAEVVVPSGGTRLDFQVAGHASDPRLAWVEVKSVTLAEGSRARFPDAVTERGRKHLTTLRALHREGARAVLLFVVQRGDCDTVEPADDIDPAYGQALREAADAGVEILAVRARVRASEIRLEKMLPVLL